jgi:hypothetical protein
MADLAPEPSQHAAERATYEQFLDYYRSVVARKLAGLSEEQARRIHAPSGMTIIGVVLHLTGVELWWFVDALAGRNPQYRRTVAEMQADRDAEWKPGDDETVAVVLDAYTRACDQARRAAADFALDDVARLERVAARSTTLRWIYVHMIEETARHAGHLDLLREAIDGATGD